jgi:hypothetical protein
MTDTPVEGATSNGNNVNIDNDLNVISQLQKNTTPFTPAAGCSQASAQKIGIKRRANALISTSKMARSSSNVDSTPQVNVLAFYLQKYMYEYC